jgi:hypothetical protein
VNPISCSGAIQKNAGQPRKGGQSGYNLYPAARMVCSP